MLWQTRPLNPLCVCLAKKQFAWNFSLTPQSMQHVCHVAKSQSGGRGVEWEGVLGAFGVQVVGSH